MKLRTWFSFSTAVAALLAAGFYRSAIGAEVTVESLTSSAVSDVGPHYADVEEAIKKFNGRDVEGARKLLTEAKKKTPKLAPPEVMLFTLMANGGTMAQARGELEKAVQHYPNDPEAYLIMADIAVSENRLTEAGLLYAKASAVTEAFNENPKRKKTLQSRAYSGEGQVLEARENWQAAREKLALWLKLDSESALAHQRMGRVLFKLNDPREAYKEFQLAAKADDKVQPVEVVMAALYQQAGDKTNAERFLNQAIKKGEKDARTQIALTQWMLQTNQLKEAQKHADEAVKLDPKSIEARLLRGITARMQGDLKAAQEQFEAVHVQSPSNAVAINQLALVLIESPDADSRQRAREFAETNFRTNPKNIEAAATLGWINYKLDHVDEANRLLQAVANTGAYTPETQYYLANLLKDQGKAADAVRLLEAALQTDRIFTFRPQAQSLLAELNKSKGGESSKGSGDSAKADPAKGSSDAAKGTSPSAKGQDASKSKANAEAEKGSATPRRTSTK